MCFCGPFATFETFVLEWRLNVLTKSLVAINKKVQNYPGEISKSFLSLMEKMNTCRLLVGRFKSKL